MIIQWQFRFNKTFLLSDSGQKTHQFLGVSHIRRNLCWYFSLFLLHYPLNLVFSYLPKKVNHISSYFKHTRVLFGLLNCKFTIFNTFLSGKAKTQFFQNLISLLLLYLLVNLKSNFTFYALIVEGVSCQSFVLYIHHIYMF